MRHFFEIAIAMILAIIVNTNAMSQERRPIDSEHPLWLVHIDVWNKADPQKIIDLIPNDIKPYVCMNLSLSCQYDTEKNVYKMPQNAVRTYKSWASVCQQNGLWFTCQPASGGHTHIQDDDLETFEYFFQHYPNFLGWNYAEQFWGFDEANDKSSSTQLSRIALFAKLVEMSHKYGGFLTISFCGNIWSHPLNPTGMMKRNADLMAACKAYPDAILWLYKYTTSSCFYNNESVTYGPYISGMAKNYGVRYDNCGWNGALDDILGKNHGKKYPVAAGIGTVMEQTGINGGAVWDGPELIWTEDFQNLSNTNIDGYTRRNWGTFPGFRNAWIDMFRKIIDGTIYIPTREDVIERTQIVVVNDVKEGDDEAKYAAWSGLYDDLYKVSDPFNSNGGDFMDNLSYMKGSGRYATIAITPELSDDLAKKIPVVVKKSEKDSRWGTKEQKVEEFNSYYAEVSTGNLFVARLRNQLVTYTPYSYLNTKTTASAEVPLMYNTCTKLNLEYGQLSSGLIREYAEKIDIYLNNYRTDISGETKDVISVAGATKKPETTMTKRAEASGSMSEKWDEATGTYTVEVSHNGPIDLTINCSGNAKERETDVLPSKALGDKPKQPEPFYGEIVIEAEDMDYKGIQTCELSPYDFAPEVMGHTGNGFIKTGTDTNGSLKGTLNLANGGNYTIGVRYNSTIGQGDINIVVNDETQTTTCVKTGKNEWKTATVNAKLKAGLNTIVINNKMGLNMMVDNVTFTPEGTEAEKYRVTIREAEEGKVVASASEAAEGEKITLTVTPEDGYELRGWEIVHGNVKITTSNTFTMPDDNVTLRPLFTDVSATYILDYSEVGNGTMPKGWQATQGNNETHKYPESYGAGARTFAGFEGYQGKALYWREDNAEYGRQSGYQLSLTPGTYKMTYAMAAWKGEPEYTASIIKADGTEIAKDETYVAKPNADGSTAANISSAEMRTLEFEVTEAGNYIIHFQSAGGFSEYLLAACKIRCTSGNAIEDIRIDNAEVTEVYGLDGSRRQSLERGINIVKTSDGKTHKLLIK